ncbi:MAG: hypothetical protein CMN03_00795 [Roseibacillus sp.]|nr:hypothetical protein [Roseibacillus sp.]
MKTSLSALALLSLGYSQAFGALVVNEDLGVLGLGGVNLVGNTADGEDNAQSYTGFLPQGGWAGSEWVFQFAIEQERVVSLTSNALTGDPDTFLLNSLETVDNEGNQEATGGLLAAFLDGAPPETRDFGTLNPGTYFLSVEAFGGDSSATFDFTLDIAAAPLPTFGDSPDNPIALGVLGNDSSLISLDTFGSAIDDTELGVYSVGEDGSLSILESGGGFVLNDDAGDGFQSAVEFTAPEGNYLAVAGAFNMLFFLDGIEGAGSQDGAEITLNHNGDSTTGATNNQGVAWFSFAVVPEPSSMSLIALAGLTLLRRRRS